MVSAGLTLYESMNMYPLRSTANYIPKQGSRQRLLQKKDLNLFTGIHCFLATYSDGSHPAYFFLFLNFPFFYVFEVCQRSWNIWDREVSGSSAVRIRCCKKWFTHFPKGAAFQPVTTSWQHLKGTQRAWKAEAMIQRATVSGKKTFFGGITKIQILLVFRAIQTIKGGAAHSNWAHLCVFKDGWFGCLFTKVRLFPTFIFWKDSGNQKNSEPCAMLGLPMCPYNIRFLLLVWFCFPIGWEYYF